MGQSILLHSQSSARYPGGKGEVTRSASLMEMRLSRPEWSSRKRCSRVRSVQGEHLAQGQLQDSQRTLLVIIQHLGTRPVAKQEAN